MIRYIEFPPKSTAEIFEKLKAAGEGATLRVIPRGAEDGGVHFDIAIVSAASTDDPTCDDPTNDSRPCPPFC